MATILVPAPLRALLRGYSPQPRATCNGKGEIVIPFGDQLFKTLCENGYEVRKLHDFGDNMSVVFELSHHSPRPVQLGGGKKKEKCGNPHEMFASPSPSMSTNLSFLDPNPNPVVSSSSSMGNGEMTDLGFLTGVPPVDDILDFDPLSLSPDTRSVIPHSMPPAMDLSQTNLKVGCVDKPKTPETPKVMPKMLPKPSDMSDADRAVIDEFEAKLRAKLAAGKVKAVKKMVKKLNDFYVLLYKGSSLEVPEPSVLVTTLVPARSTARPLLRMVAAPTVPKRKREEEDEKSSSAVSPPKKKKSRRKVEVQPQFEAMPAPVVFDTKAFRGKFCSGVVKNIKTRLMSFMDECGYKLEPGSSTGSYAQVMWMHMVSMGLNDPTIEGMFTVG